MTKRNQFGMTALLVITNMPDVKSAQTLATGLIEQHLAACVNVLATCKSVYPWQGKVETSDEVPLLIKTTAERYAALQEVIRKQHPYELPEIIAIPVSNGLPAYLDWVNQECTAPPT